MLHLQGLTDPEWGRRAVVVIDEILLDHAHLEKKAASTALQLLFLIGHHPGAHRTLSELAREELAHFELVTERLEERGLAFRKQRPGAYPGQIRKLLRTTSEAERTLDLLIVSCLIEARSCERMSLLAEALTEEPLRSLYAGLLRSEARHHMVYIELAESLFGRDATRVRLEVLAAAEAAIVAQLPCEPRLHSNL